MAAKKTTAVAPRQTAVAQVPDGMPSEADIKAYFCPDNVTPQEWGVIKAVIHANGLNPAKRECYIVKYGNSPAQVITGYQVYVQRAEATGKLAGWKVGVIRNDTGQVVGARIEIYRTDFQECFSWDCETQEWDTGQSMWRSRPGFMTKKVCIGQGFRLAFPNELGSLPYLAEEISGRSEQEVDIDARIKAQPQQVQAEPVTQAPSPPPAAPPKAPPAAQQPAGGHAEVPLEVQDNTAQAPQAAQQPPAAAPAPAPAQAAPAPAPAAQAPQAAPAAPPVDPNQPYIQSREEQDRRDQMMEFFPTVNITAEEIQVIAQKPIDQLTWADMEWLSDQYFLVEEGEQTLEQFKQSKLQV